MSGASTIAYYSARPWHCIPILSLLRRKTGDGDDSKLLQIQKLTRYQVFVFAINLDWIVAPGHPIANDLER